MSHSKPEVVKAILDCLLNNPNSDDEQVRRSAPDLLIELSEVRWFRRCFYRVIRLIEEGAANWHIPQKELAAKTVRQNGKKGELDLITAVTWAIMRHPNLQEHDALEAAGVETTRDTTRYPLEAHTIFQEVKNFSVEELERYRNNLCEQMRVSVGKNRSQNWVDELEKQIYILRNLAR